MKNKRKLEELSAEQFLGDDFSDSDEESSSSAPEKSLPKQRKQKVIGIEKTKKKKMKKKVNAQPPEKTEKVKNIKRKTLNNTALPDSVKNGSGAEHKASLNKLKDQDPEFYKFLQQEGQDLLSFNPSDEESDGSDTSENHDGDSSVENEESEDDIKSTDSEEDEQQLKKLNKKKTKMPANKEESDLEDSESEDDDAYKLPDKLEEVSDSEEDDEQDDEEGSRPDKTRKRDTRKPVTMKLIHQWTTDLAKSSDTQSIAAFREVVQAFRAAVQRAGSQNVEKSIFRVEGSSVFNAVVRLCMRDLPMFLNSYIKPMKPKDSKKIVLPSHSPQFNAIRKEMMSYLADMIELLSQLADPGVLNVVLKHITQMIPYFAIFPKINKAMLKRLIAIWSSGEETSRVLAFISLNRLVRLRQETFLEYTVKQMYLSYVKNCKFTSPTTLPLINFMQRSVVEIFAIDHELTYQYAFMYIRQLAIHLRNAITVKKQDTCQSVYNWQYVHSLMLWCRTLSQLYPSVTLEPLIYPLVQTITGTIKLIPTARYFPLRFHCVRGLNMLSAATKTFIPVLPFLVEIFELTDFNKKHKSLSFKPFNFACILKLSKSQVQEKSFRDGVIDQLYEHLMDTFQVHAHTIGFPELALPAIMQMKKFVKQCKVSNYTKQIKQIIDKVEETSKLITQRRKTATLSLTENKAVEMWEQKSKEEGTPLGKYYATWRKLRDRELQHEMSGKDQISYDDLPTITRPTKDQKTASAKERKEFTGLFASDSEESDDENRFLLKDERPKKQKTEERYENFTEKELARLDRSASEDEDSDDSIEIESDDDGSDDDGDSGDDAEDIGENSMEQDELDESDGSDQKDIVKDFQFSSDED